MRNVSDDGTKLTHDREPAHINHHVLVAKHGATFGQPGLRISRFVDLSDRMFHRLGRQELTLLHIDNLACFGRCHQQIGLTAQEGWYLQNIHAIRRHGRFIRCVNIRRCPDAHPLANGL